MPFKAFQLLARPTARAVPQTERLPFPLFLCQLVYLYGCARGGGTWGHGCVTLRFAIDGACDRVVIGHASRAGRSVDSDAPVRHASDVGWGMHVYLCIPGHKMN